jgi:predicted component of type VI protein secretion system
MNMSDEDFYREQRRRTLANADSQYAWQRKCREALSAGYETVREHENAKAEGSKPKWRKIL